ncbi:hypothetical protein L1281_001992 [Neisseria sp. HSC-16F19]|nr:SMI1/KNR4 family protein [Neisseria sp. HSC-16F19]MCP2041394.1 hypothetical protein [Neisseria sp. HSC-16F19]
MDIPALLQQYLEAGDYQTATPPTKADIQAAAQQLGVQFPHSFVDFVRQVDWLTIDNQYFYGIPHGLSPEGNVVRMTAYARDTWQLPPDYIVISSSDDVVLWCLHTGEPNPPLMACDTAQHSFGGRVADSLQHALYDYITAA